MELWVVDPPLPSGPRLLVATGHAINASLSGGYASYAHAHIICEQYRTVASPALIVAAKACDELLAIRQKLLVRVKQLKSECCSGALSGLLNVL